MQASRRLEAILLDEPSWRRCTNRAASAGVQPECQRHVTQKKTHVFAVLTEGINLNEETIIPFIRISPN